MQSSHEESIVVLEGSYHVTDNAMRCDAFDQVDEGGLISLKPTPRVSVSIY